MRPAARVGDEVVLLPGEGDLRELIAAGPQAWREARARAAADSDRLPLDAVEPVLPVAPRDYVDFYASLEHATAVGGMFRPDRPLEPNWRHLPVGYHGRASTVAVSGTPVHRPLGQRGEGDFGATRALDLECEVGLVVGPATQPGERVPVERAEERIFGAVLVNDWSARDLQAWEYRPLGPFLGKSFLTSISAWVVPWEDLEGCRPAARRQDPPPLAYLRDPRPRALGLALEVEVDGEIVSRPHAGGLYWTPAQLLAHATVNGAALSAGDLFATGTVSGQDQGTQGCLLELWRGERFLEDGSEVVLRGRCGDLELGEVRGTVLPSS